ncbi:MAG: cyclic nucleotide-binding protein [Betaproteobacteria bacterium]|nr:MAG: cyclic nucleotide-binding protein [Betaproteobacteria bacterium]
MRLRTRIRTDLRSGKGARDDWGSEMTGHETSVLGLRRVALLDGLSEAALAAIARECAWRHYVAGQRIVSRDADDRNVHFVVAGRVRATTYSRSGRQVTFRDQQAGDFLGEVAAIDGLPRSVDVVALESTLVASMTPAAFERLLQEQPLVAGRVLRRLAGLVRGLSERVIDLSTLGVQNRIHAELLRLARAAGVRDNAARIDPAPPHADIASQVSTYREQVTRELSALVKTGLLAKDRRALVVLDVARLGRLVEEVRGAA